MKKDIFRSLILLLFALIGSYFIFNYTESDVKGVKKDINKSEVINKEEKYKIVNLYEDSSLVKESQIVFNSHNYKINYKISSLEVNDREIFSTSDKIVKEMVIFNDLFLILTKTSEEFSLYIVNNNGGIEEVYKTIVIDGVKMYLGKNNNEEIEIPNKIYQIDKDVIKIFYTALDKNLKVNVNNIDYKFDSNTCNNLKKKYPTALKNVEYHYSVKDKYGSLKVKGLFKDVDCNNR